MTTGSVVWAQNIVVNEFPDGCGFLRANFSIDTGDPNLVVDTDGLRWDLGNGNFADEILNPGAFYELNNGIATTYNISVSGSYTNGNPIVVTPVEVTVKAPPIAEINTMGLTTGTCALAPLQVTFDGSASTDPEGGDLTYFWVLGDGTVSDEETLTHTYNAPGIYNVTLTVRDEEGCTDITALNQDITVSEGFNLAFNAIGELQTCNLPNTIQFEATHELHRLPLQE